MRYIFVLILLCASSCIQAQDEYRNLNFFTSKDGLSNNNVHCITKDSRGFLWIGTVEGLNRFDGLHFKKYFAAKDISQSLSANSVFSIIEYRFGQLLIGTSNGLSVLNTITGKFENDKISFAALRMGSGNQVNSFFKDKQGRIWIDNNGEIDILDSNLNYIQRFTDLEWAKSLKGVKVIFENWYSDKQGRLWLPSDISGINIIDFSAKQVFNYKNNPKNLPYLKFNYIRSMLVDEASNVLWYAPWGAGLMRYDLANNKLQQQLFNIEKYTEKASINCIAKTNSGELLCVSPTGIFRVNTVTLQYSNDEHIGSLQKQSLDPVDLFYDNQSQSYWLGTVKGLLHFTNRSVATDLIINKNRAKPIKFNNIIQANGKLYAVFTGHLVEVQEDRKSFQIYSLPNKRAATDGLCLDKNGVIWIGSNEGVFLFNTEIKKLSRYLLLPKPQKSNIYNTIFCDQQGDVWLTTRDQLNIYKVSKQNTKVERINNSVIEKFTDGRVKNIITQITEDLQKNIWMISELGNGILCFNKPSAQWSLFPATGTKNNEVLKKSFFLINAINNSLWLNSDYIGLIKYEPKKNDVRIFTRNDGLISDFIIGVNYDEKSNLWLLTEKGITQFNIHTNKVKSNGLSNIEFKGPNVISTYDKLTNSIVYGTPDGLSFLHLDRIPFGNDPPVPIINEVTVNNKTQFIDPRKSFSLKYNQNTISIDFTAVQFTDADKIKFAYKLTGVDKEWQYADVNRGIQYANIAPGNFTFLIKTGNESGTWSKEYSCLTFSIYPPFWRTWWFLLIAASIVVFTIYMFMLRRIRQIKKEENLKHEINEAFLRGQIIERKRVSADLHDEIGSALSTISIFSDLAKRKAEKTAPELVNEMERIGLKSREMIQTMRDTIWTISENNSQNLWERMQQYGTETLTARDISFSWQASFDDQLDISFLVKKNLFMAYKEALNNIAKHSEATAVSVKIFQENSKLSIEISDNGKGFDLAAIEKGNGIKNFKNRMEEIGGNATIMSVRGEGTKLLFSMTTDT